MLLQVQFMNFVSQMISIYRVYFDYVFAFVSINHILVNHYPSLTESENSSLLEMNADFIKVILKLARIIMKSKIIIIIEERYVPQKTLRSTTADCFNVNEHNLHQKLIFIQNDKKQKINKEW